MSYARAGAVTTADIRGPLSELLAAARVEPHDDGMAVLVERRFGDTSTFTLTAAMGHVLLDLLDAAKLGDKRYAAGINPDVVLALSERGLVKFAVGGLIRLTTEGRVTAGAVKGYLTGELEAGPV